MSRSALQTYIEAETKSLRQGGLLRPELRLTTPQGPVIRAADQEIVSFASNDYLGLATHPEVKKAASSAIETWGVGLASPRAMVGTLALHQELESVLAKLLGTEDALVYASGHHANTGLFEAMLGDRDYVFCDEMMRPSLADGIRLSRARAYGYRNNDMEHLEDRLKRSRAARFRIIATDGVFPVTGRVANLSAIYELAAKYHATVVVDDSQGLGVLGGAGEGTHASLALEGKIELVTGSFGNALGGGAGGFAAGRAPLINWLRQKSRSHLTSTALTPSAVAVALKAIELCRTQPQLRKTLNAKLQIFKDGMTKDAGLIPDVTHPAVSVLTRNAVATQRLADMLYRQKMFAIGYCHPVVAEGDARLGIRITAQHSDKDLEAAAKAIGDGMKELKIQL